MASSVRKVRCPICGRRTPWKENPYRPFCSRECKLADLHNWLSEEYRIKIKTVFVYTSKEENHEGV